jgi:hypothetical protein
MDRSAGVITPGLPPPYARDDGTYAAHNKVGGALTLPGQAWTCSNMGPELTGVA